MFVPDWPAMPRLMFCQGVLGTFLRHYQGMLLALPTNMRLCYNTCKFNPGLVLRYEVLGLRLVAPKLQKLYQTLMTTFMVKACVYWQCSLVKTSVRASGYVLALATLSGMTQI